MTEFHSDAKAAEPVTESPSAPEPLPAEPVYTYATAGMGERKGHVPMWLWMVAVSLAIWGIYYLYMYWSPPGHS